MCRDGFLLDAHYDQEHRSRLILEDGRVIQTISDLLIFLFHRSYYIAMTIELVFLQMLNALKIRYHSAKSSDMPYNEKYTPFFAEFGLLPFITTVTRSTPNMNSAAITALVDRWRPETHSFHLPVGEMTVTLQDVSMITALPINGEPVCEDTDSAGWRQEMIDLIGRAPAQGEFKTLAAGAPYHWIVQNFGQCPENADRDTVVQYARAYAWWVLSRTLFGDSGGKLAQWWVLKQLTTLGADRETGVAPVLYSWGTAALAYLYRQVITCVNCIHY